MISELWFLKFFGMGGAESFRYAPYFPKQVRDKPNGEWQFAQLELKHRRGGIK